MILQYRHYGGFGLEKYWKKRWGLVHSVPTHPSLRQYLKANTQISLFQSSHSWFGAKSLTFFQIKSTKFEIDSQQCQHFTSNLHNSNRISNVVQIEIYTPTVIFIWSWLAKLLQVHNFKRQSVCYGCYCYSVQKPSTNRGQKVESQKVLT